MYVFILIALIAAGLALFFLGLSKRKVFTGVFGLCLLALTILFFWFMGFFGNMLWFENLGFGSRFWRMIIAQVGSTLGGLLVTSFIMGTILLLIGPARSKTRAAILLVSALIGAVWGYNNWDTILRFLHAVQSGVSDPVFHRDAGFYLFILPFLDSLRGLLLFVIIIAGIVSFASGFLRISGEDVRFLDRFDATRQDRMRFNAIYIIGGFLLFVLAFGTYLARFHLMYSTWGAVRGAGWTDVHVRLPMYTVLTAILVLMGIVTVIAPLRKRLQRGRNGSDLTRSRPHITYIGVTAGVVFFSWLLLLSIIPGLFQWLRVEPNEISFEEEYIARNIEFTRRGFNLDNIEERAFAVSDSLTMELKNRNESLFSNIRLWDWRALDSVYEQFQEIRLYYEFIDVDIDRYHIGEEYRQVMVSPREMNTDNLPGQSKTFVNRRFKYTHGYGIAMNTVSDFTPEGLPNLLIRDIPPKNDHPDLEIRRPEIYYGELTDEHVIVNTREEELDYPSGEDNVYTHYAGTGGVTISDSWRKFLFGWMFDGTRLFLSGYPTGESRIMFRRQISERVKTLAPFLTFDKDPYIVLADGRLYWIVDAYTTSSYYPYSEPFSAREEIEYSEGEWNRSLRTSVVEHLKGANYLRNSVKVVVDSYNGSVDFYVFDEKDPVIMVWRKIFPSLFKDQQVMPGALRSHIRYPIDFLLVQGLMYAKYHMTDPTVFYNQEDLWIRATEKYYDQVQPVEPYYIMWQPPDASEPQFILMLPFTPKKRQVLIGWIAGLCDGEDYGRFLAYKFPKDRRVLGTQQVETKIDQDSFLAGQLTLWDQRGSQVIRGNVLVIPIDETLIYVEPIYLQAETAAYPELRLVVIMHGDRLSYAETFEEALNELFTAGPVSDMPGVQPLGIELSLTELSKEANQAFENYLRLMGEGNIRGASDELQRLQQTLNRMSEQSDMIQQTE